MEIQRNLCINVDFDGTVVTHDYPRVGKDIGSQPVLKKLVAKGHKLILFTMRGDDKSYLKQAIAWFKDNDIPLYGINCNPEQKSWTCSPKSHADMIIDDTALGCPLKIDKKLSYYPFIDWEKVEKMLIDSGVI